MDYIFPVFVCDRLRNLIVALPYENMSMQYSAIFHDSKNENF